MPYPPAVPPNTRTDATGVTTNHPSDHTTISNALTDILNELGTDPSGVAVSVTARLNALPLGVVGYAQIVANTAAVGAVTDVTGLSVTFTAVAGRRYKTSIVCGQFATIAGDGLSVMIADGAGTQLMRHTFLVPVNNCESAVSTRVVETGLSGSVTRKVQHQRLSGTGTSTVTAAATYPASILVEDIGPA